MKLGTNFEAYDAWRLNEPRLVEVFRQFKSLRVDSAELAARLPPLLPRFYSIASCPNNRIGLNNEIVELKPGFVHLDLLLSVVKYETRGCEVTF